MRVPGEGRALGMADEAILPSQRHLFDIPPGVAYLNCAAQAPLPRAVREAGGAALTQQSQPWAIRSADTFADVERARALFAGLIGADTDGVALVPSVSYGLAVAAANIPLAPGRRVVLLADQFPSNVYVWREVVRRSGATIDTAPRPPDDDWTAAVLAHVDERTAVVAVPQCHWTDGGLLDLARVGTRAREVGAALVVDATQSVGAMPLDVSGVRPDFLVTIAYKWLLGPQGLGFLYVAPRHREGPSIEFNWVARAGSEDFTQLTDYRDTRARGARRFDMGGRNNSILLPPTVAALEQLTSWGPSAIAATIRPLTERADSGVTRLGLRVAPSHRRAPHIIGLRFPEGMPADLSTRLAGRGVFASVRGDALRVSPHVYNTPDDIDRLCAALAAALSSCL